MARTPTKAAKPAADRDREKRALDNAARRVPVWQVSVTSALLALIEAESTPDELAAKIKRALDQVPAAVIRAGQMNRRGQWKPL